MRDEHTADLVRDGAPGGVVEFGDDDVRALVGEPPGDARADAGARTGHQRDLAGQRARHRATPGFRRRADRGLRLAVEGTGGARDDLPPAVDPLNRKWFAPARAP